MFPLGKLFRGLVKRGRLRVTDFDGQIYEFGDDAAPLDAAIVLRDRSTAWRIAYNPELNIGEAFVDGSLTIEKGTLFSFLRLLLINSQSWNDSLPGRLYYRLEDIIRMPAVLNPVPRSRRNVKHHYDLSDELFSLFLDADRQYSCAYYRSEDDDLETAQLSKKQHLAAKLNIHPGQHILDIGSGWGGLALYLASHYPVRVTGLTLSDEQFRHANERARQLGVADRVAFKLLDYRKETGAYDRVVSVGMFEHVGRPQFSAFFRQLYALLKPDGVARRSYDRVANSARANQPLAAPAYFPRRLSSRPVAAGADHRKSADVADRSGESAPPLRKHACRLAPTLRSQSRPHRAAL